MFQKRGIFFNGATDTQSVTINNIGFYKNFTVAMWIKPVEGDGSLFNFEVNRGKLNGNLFVSSCMGLGLNWATFDMSTPKNSLSTDHWSFISMSVEKADTVVDILLYVNGSQSGHGMTNEQLNTSSTQMEYLGSIGSYTHFYKGFMYSFDYYEFARAATTVNTSCEDLNTDSILDCPFCLGDNSCLGKCDVDEWDSTGTCTDCTPSAGEVCNATGTATAGCSGCTCV
jgi:hypothetical protein